MVLGMMAFLSVSTMVLLGVAGLLVIAVPAIVVVVFLATNGTKSGSEEEVVVLRAEVQRLRAENERLRNGSA